MKKSLVVYFSVTGTTKTLAEKLSKEADADLFEIKPVAPYTQEDLDWTNENSRSTVEMKKDKTIRPEIANKVENISQYDTIYIGFPIWWYIAPTIINSFLEQYDLKGKKIIPFATSGGSDMGDTNKELRPSCEGANLVEGRRFSENVPQSELREWINSLN